MSGMSQWTTLAARVGGKWQLPLLVVSTVTLPASVVMLRPNAGKLPLKEASETLDSTAYMQTFKRHAHLPIQDMLARFEAELDRDSGSLKPHDDITMVGLEVLP
ncbi:MAG: hypothetical protein IIB59_03425 [Planctomycetes bacterium]|nr:hypothetical protein [Planctomycetota bacterium]